MLSRKLPKLNRAGDTIVEVLIAITVISTILGAAYVTANKSLQTSQRSQERVEALRLAQSQLELLKVHQPSSPTSAFCLNYDSANSEYKDYTIPDPSDFSSYPDTCKYSNERYHVSVQADGDNTYDVKIVWDQLGGSRGEVSILYRLAQ